MNINLCKTKIFALTLLGILLTTSSTSAFANQQLFGQLTVEGNYETVTMDGEIVYDERTVSSGTDIVTSPKSSARISFGEVGQLGLAPNSKINLNFDETKISGVFVSGQLTIAVEPNIEIIIQTADGIITNPDRSKNSVIIIDFVNGKTRVKAEIGVAALNGIIIKEGKTSSLRPPKITNQKENDGIFSAVLISLAKAMYVEELLGIETQTTTLRTNITDSVSQVNVGPMTSD